MKNKKDLYFYISFWAIFFLGLFLRVYKLALRPLHHDEGVLWYFFVKKLLEGKPMEFYFEQHGLLTYYLAALPVYFLKTSIFSLRLSAAIFGSLVILPLLWLKKEIGRIAVLAASLFVAISPIMVFYSRFLIGYPFFDFFFVLAIVFLAKYLKNFKNIYFYLFFLSLTSMALVNEAILVFFGVSLISLLAILPFKKWRQKIVLAFKRIKPKTWALSVISAIFLFLIIQTCFFREWLNLFKLENVFSEMLKKSSQTGQNKPFGYYFNKVILLTDIYWIGLAVFAFFAGFLKAGKKFFEDRFSFLAFFSFVFALFSFLIFSFIHYKTPWVLAMVILPIALFAGMAFGLFFKEFKKSKMIIFFFSAVFLSVVFQTFFWTVNYNFKIYANEAKNPLAYVGTTLDINKLTKDIINYKSSHRLEKVKILIKANSYWPIPYYFRDESFVLYYQDIGQNYDLIISNQGDVPKETSYKKEYFLRNGYKIIVWQPPAKN